jgi:hypothetical protein
MVYLVFWGFYVLTIAVPVYCFLDKDFAVFKTHKATNFLPFEQQSAQKIKYC